MECACPDGTRSVHLCTESGDGFTPCVLCPEVIGVGGASSGGAGGTFPGAGGAGGAGGTAPFVPDAIDLLADTNRSGLIEFDDATEDVGEDAWSANHGAVFLANLDDDLEACPRSGDDFSLPQCHDAADDFVNGPDDVLDLAPLAIRAWPDAPEGAVARLEVERPGATRVRLFVDEGGALRAFDPVGTTFGAGELRAGVRLLLEGTDVVRDAATWNGILDVGLVVSDPSGAELGRDRVQLRVAPVVLHHHLMPAQRIHVTESWGDGLSSQFVGAIRTAASAAGVPGGVHAIASDDPWTQDFFEPAYTSMPAPGGGQHVLRIYLRSANTRTPAPLLRASGQVVFREFRGRDAGGLQEFDPARAPHDDTFDSMGNTETIPPFTHAGVEYPLGRILRGSVPSFAPDRAFARLLESQAVQPPVYIDTSWLEVGHVDETISFVRASTPRGWVALVNDPRLARTMLEDQERAGYGHVPMFVGKWSAEGYPAERSISAVLQDSDVMSASQAAAAEIDQQLQVLASEVGLGDADVVRVPHLHTRGYGRSIAYQPATVNGVYLADGHFAAPDPHGPVIGGVDIMKAQFEQALGAVGVAVHWIEDWDLYHVKDGEVHCGTNTTRQVPSDTKWWESGR